METEQTTERSSAARRGLPEVGGQFTPNPQSSRGWRGTFASISAGVGLALAAAVIAASCGRSSTPQVQNVPWQSAKHLGGDPTHGNVLRRALMHRYR
jgi:hypothetical protein